MNYDIIPIYTVCDNQHKESMQFEAVLQLDGRFNGYQICIDTLPYLHYLHIFFDIRLVLYFFAGLKGGRGSDIRGGLAIKMVLHHEGFV